MKKWMKAIAAMMVLSMAMTGCGGSGDSADAEGKYKVGIVQQLEHPALDAASLGFQEKLTELMDGNVVFDYQNAQGEQTNCTTIATKFVSDQVDLIMANATTALQSAAAATADIPIVGTSVTDYVTAGVVESNEAPGRNVTGASDLAPIDEQIAILMELVPDVQKVGIVYCSAEPNSIYQSELAQAELDKAGVAWAEFTAADSNEVQAVVTKAVSECDVLYVPTDNTMANNTEIIKNVAVPAGVPVIAGEEGMCAGCGVATLSISYYDLGAKAAEMAYEILVNGASPAEMPIAYVSEGITEKYNAELAEKLNITSPEGMVAIGE
ncbi:MAG: ABC transporter substrate-binding protein [Anaerotignum sp.]|nr:ABC transporter substrate-binding protein [Anaerotignum sp.]